jgi:hypothetical protein
MTKEQEKSKKRTKVEPDANGTNEARKRDQNGLRTGQNRRLQTNHS